MSKSDGLLAKAIVLAAITGTEVAALYGAQRNEGAYGVNLKWVAPSSLHIEYLRVRSIVRFVPNLFVDGHPIAVTFDSGITDSFAKGGAMSRGSHQELVD